MSRGAWKEVAPDFALFQCDVARLLGISDTTWCLRVKTGKAPPPDGYTASNRAYWKESTVAQEKAALSRFVCARCEGVGSIDPGKRTTAKYCNSCRTLIAREQVRQYAKTVAGKVAQKKASKQYKQKKAAEQKRDRPWALGVTLVCWLDRECAACGQQKPRSAYRQGKAKSPDGLESICLQCASRRKSCRWLFATSEQRKVTTERRRKWSRSEAGKAFRAKQPKNPEHEHSYRRKRLERLAQQDDGTVTGAILRKEFARTHCPYCANPMQTKDKQLDHMHPLALGGLHSACNVLVCCAACNGRKAHLPFSDWLSALEPAQQTACRALWVKRYGAPPEQMPMLLPDPGVTKRKVETLKQRTTRQAIAEAKRARAAWFKRDASDEWVAAYWEGMGEPWRNPHITQAERFRLRYELMPGFREAQQAKVRRWKERNPSMVADQRVRRRERQANDAAH